jgi:hypothetical protein
MKFALERTNGIGGRKCKEREKILVIGSLKRGETADEWPCLCEVLQSVKIYDIVKKNKCSIF